jgi:hypothetical protein
LLRPTSRPAYAYLFGLYLGDGCLVGVHRGVFRLQLTLDASYPAIVQAACDAVRAVLPSNKVRASHRTNAIDVTCYSKLWPVLFPQHGTGKKHERDVRLVAWQQKLTTAHPRELIKGLIHSDGCRYIARPVINGWNTHTFATHSGTDPRTYCESSLRT